MLWAKIDLFVWGLMVGLVISDFVYSRVTTSTYLFLAIFSVLGILRLINFLLARHAKMKAVAREERDY